VLIPSVAVQRPFGQGLPVHKGGTKGGDHLPARWRELVGQAGCTLTAVTLYSGQLATSSVQPEVSSFTAHPGSGTPKHLAGQHLVGQVHAELNAAAPATYDDLAAVAYVQPSGIGWIQGCVTVGHRDPVHTISVIAGS
jgi:hypothetical protein